MSVTTRINRALRNKRFWRLLFVVCFFLGHKVKGESVPKGFRLVSGEYVDGWHSYCARCSSVCPDGADALDWWHRNLFHRTVGRSWSATKNLYYFRYWWPVKMFFSRRAVRLEQAPKIRRFMMQHPGASSTECSLYMGSYITQETVDKVLKEVLQHDFRKGR